MMMIPFFAALFISLQAGAYPPPCNPEPVVKNVQIQRREITVSIIGFDRPALPTDSKGPTVDRCFNYWKKAMDREIANKPDLVVLPEGVDSWVGMTPAGKRDWVLKRGNLLLEKFRGYAREHSCYLVFNSYRQKSDGGQCNTSYMIDREGDVIAVYDKVYPTPTAIEWEEFPISPGLKPVVVDTDFGRVGFVTCFDLNFEDLREEYRKLAPDVLCFCSAYSGDFWQRVWSYGCGCHLVAATVGKLSKDISGPSGEALFHFHDYFQTATAKINTNCTVCHLDGNRQKILAAIAKYGPRFQFRSPGAVGCVTLFSTDPDLDVMDVVREFDIELWPDYYSRSQSTRLKALKD